VSLPVRVPAPFPTRRSSDLDKGQVMLDDTDITQLSSKELMLARRGIGMIFQHFNLLSSQTIFNNIAFPLRLQKLTSSEINQRVKDRKSTRLNSSHVSISYAV